MSVFIRVDARVWVLRKDVEAVRRIVPPRWAELWCNEEARFLKKKNAQRYIPDGG